jgi:ABC-type uncharacterized transport system substrate-binding protein
MDRTAAEPSTNLSNGPGVTRSRRQFLAATPGVALLAASARPAESAQPPGLRKSLALIWYGQHVAPAYETRINTVLTGKGWTLIGEADPWPAGGDALRLVKRTGNWNLGNLTSAISTLISTGPQPDIFLTGDSISPHAAKAVLPSPPPVPVVMAIAGDIVGQGLNIPGFHGYSNNSVVLALVRLNLLRPMLCNRNVAVLLNTDSESAKLQWGKIAGAGGLTLTQYVVKSPGDVMPALNGIPSPLGGVFVISDPVTTEHAAVIKGWAAAKQVPVMFSTPDLVSGTPPYDGVAHGVDRFAILTLALDMVDDGLRTGTIVTKPTPGPIIKGGRPNNLCGVPGPGGPLTPLAPAIAPWSPPPPSVPPAAPGVPVI